MMGTLTTILLVLLSLIAQACAPVGRRYWTVQTVTASADAGHYVDVTLFATSPPAADPNPFVLKLSERGQKALIGGLAAKSEDSATLLKNVTSGADAGPAPTLLDKTKMRRRVVFSVLRDGFSMKPADRIDEVVVKLCLLDPSQAQFVPWDRFSTQYDTVDLGKLTLKNSDQLELSFGGPKLADDKSSKVEESAKYTHGTEQSQELQLRQRIVTLGGSLSQFRATLYQQRGRRHRSRGHLTCRHRHRQDP